MEILKNYLEEIVYSMYYPGICLEGLGKPSAGAVRIVSVLTQIRTENLSNRSLESDL
jgi:hypothetical protein